MAVACAVPPTDGVLTAIESAVSVTGPDGASCDARVDFPPQALASTPAAETAVTHNASRGIG